MPGHPAKRWAFASRFHRNAFGWRSRPAVAGVKEAVVEIRKIARDDPTLAAEGAVLFLTKVSAVLTHVDGSSGAIGTAVNRAIGVLAPIIAGATEDEAIRGRWLDRLWRVLKQDEMPYIESLGDYWGDMCGSEATASSWADRLLAATGDALDRTSGEFRYFVGTVPCLSALLRARRYPELIELVGEYKFWPYRRWAADALVALGRKSEALRAAESCRSGFGLEPHIDRYCEELLLSMGLRDEAYRRYGLKANRSGTRLAWFRAVVKKYPDRSEAEILEDLVALTPKDEGTWFAAAKSAGLYDRALEIARFSPCDPRTLTRAARDFLDQNPQFAMESGLTAVHWMAHGIGFEVNEADVVAAYSCTLRAADRLNRKSEALGRVRDILSGVVSKKTLVGRTAGRLLETGL